MCKNKLPDAPKQAKNPPLDQETTYHINGRSFVVQPVFKQENANSLGEVLLRLMQADCEKSLQSFRNWLTTAVKRGIIVV